MLAMEVFIELLRGRSFGEISKHYGFSSHSRCMIWWRAVALIQESPFALPNSYDSKELVKIRAHADMWLPAAANVLKVLRAVARF